MLEALYWTYGVLIGSLPRRPSPPPRDQGVREWLAEEGIPWESLSLVDGVPLPRYPDDDGQATYIGIDRTGDERVVRISWDAENLGVSISRGEQQTPPESGVGRQTVGN